MGDRSQGDASAEAGRESDLGRYHRQMLVEGIGGAGQARLRDGHAVIVGCGALGCGVADMLARAGVGTITIIDRDVVEWSNLQRQVLFDERHARDALPKAEAARQRLGEINAEVRVIAQVADLHAGTIGPLLDEVLESRAAREGRVVLVDGCDNFATRLLLNDVAVSRGVSYVYAGVLATRATVMTVDPVRVREGRTACLRCLVPDTPAPGSVGTCEALGVLGPAVGVATALQAMEAIKVLVGAVDRLSQDLIEIDLWECAWRRLASARVRDPACACCFGREFRFLSADSPTATLCGRSSFQITPGAGARVDLDRLGQSLARVGEVTVNPFLVRVRLWDGAFGDGTATRPTISVFRDGRAIVSGVDSAGRARTLFDRYVGS